MLLSQEVGVVTEIKGLFLQILVPSVCFSIDCDSYQGYMEVNVSYLLML